MGIYNKISVVFLMGLVIVMSGCTTPWGSGEKEPTMAAGTQGVVIEYFGPDVEYPVPDQNIDIKVRVKNVGGAEATEVKGTPYLLAWSNYTGTKECSSTKLEQPNIEMGKEGEECTVKWSLKTPKDITETQTYDAGVHIIYKYKTTTLATVYAFSDSEYVKLKERGETIPTVKDIKNSNAPIHVEIRMQNVLRTGNKDIPITLIFRNVGNGNVKYEDYRYKLDKVSAEIKGLGIDITTTDCDTVYMKGGKEGSCTASLDLSSVTNDELKIPIKITTEYTYTTSAETKITVHPKLT